MQYKISKLRNVCRPNPAILDSWNIKISETETLR
jgi:hypothetical protein